jgi:hypothetical protein
MQNYVSDPDREEPPADDSQLTDEQAHETCRRYLIEALRLIPFKDRIRVFAAAMKELHEDEKRRRGGGFSD